MSELGLSEGVRPLLFGQEGQAMKDAKINEHE